MTYHLSFNETYYSRKKKNNNSLNFKGPSLNNKNQKLNPSNCSRLSGYLK